jgi:hypothetical protein
MGLTVLILVVPLFLPLARGTSGMSTLSIRLRAGVPGPPFGSPSIFVYEVGQLRDIFDLVMDSPTSVWTCGGGS